MEFNEATAAQNRADSLLFTTVFMVLALVLVAALAAGGREVTSASVKRGVDRVSSFTAAPSPINPNGMRSGE